MGMGNEEGPTACPSWHSETLEYLSMRFPSNLLVLASGVEHGLLRERHPIGQL